jgi:hypothetical protein
VCSEARVDEQCRELYAHGDWFILREGLIAQPGLQQRHHSPCRKSQKPHAREQGALVWDSWENDCLFPPLSIGRTVPKEESEDACDFNIICHHHCPHCCPRRCEVSLVVLGSHACCCGFPFPVWGLSLGPCPTTAAPTAVCRVQLQASALGSRGTFLWMPPCCPA